MTLRPPVLASTLALVILTACSSGAPNREQFREVKIEAPAVQQVDPPLPAPVKLHDINWKLCGKMICATPRDAERDLSNKVEIARWMGDAQTLLRFYRNRKANLKPEQFSNGNPESK